MIRRVGELGSWRVVRRAAVYAAAAGTVMSAAVMIWIALPLPDDVLASRDADGVTIQDRSGVTLRVTRAADGSSASRVRYDAVDPDLINAFVAVEDKRFWDHHGIDPRAVARALRDNLRSRRVVSGASTITMQLARLLKPADRTYGGKVAQTLWALRLDAHLDKQRILEEYLNRVHLGQGTVGVGAASTLYFGRSASELSIAQAATLAGLAHAPSRDNPHVALAAARARRDVALTRMRRLALITREEAARARAEPMIAGARVAPFLAPHFTTHVLQWAKDADRSATVVTSLDAALQEGVEAEVRHTVSQMQDRGVMHAAAVVLDNASGEVLAWVGSPDFWASEDGQTDMVSSARQPGSALKPFLYGLAFDRGLTPATVLPDIPKAYATATGPYAPRNYDRRFRGPVRVREALASSYNVPAVEVAERVGASALLQTLHLAGFSSLDRSADYYGLGLALGNGDVTLIELANGYRALANGGTWSPWTWQHVQHAPARSEGGRRVISAVSSALVLDILADPSARVPGFGVITPFDFPFPVAVKTGTSRHFTDNWAVGTTAGFTVAVWAGNFSGRPMEGVSGITGAGPLLHRVVMLAASRVNPGLLPTPASVGAVAEPVCRLSGLRATKRCTSLTEWFAKGTAPTKLDDWETVRGLHLPDEYLSWAASSPVALAADDEDSAPANREAEAAAPSVARSPDRPIATPRLAPAATGLRLISPLDGDRYSIPIGVESKYATIPLRAAGATDLQWKIDGRAYSGTRWSLEPGEHVIEVAAPDGKSVRARVVVDR